MTTVTKETFWTQIVEDPTLYGTITTEDNLFNYRSDAVWQVMNETFIANGAEFEVTKWEELLGLSITETTLTGRKAAILNHITENLPITIGILEQLMKELTGGYYFDYNKKYNSLTVGVSQETVNNIQNLISRVIPTIHDVNYWQDGVNPEFYRLDFIESTGEQYLSVPFISNASNSSILIETEHYIDSSNILFRAEGSSSYLCQGVYNNTSFYAQADSQGSATGGVTPSSYNYHKTKFENNKVTHYLPTGGYIEKESGSAKTTGNHLLFRTTTNNQRWPGRKRFWKASVNDKIYHCIYPTLDKNGIPCMFDSINARVYYNLGTGSFIAGMTLEQAKEIYKLPSVGGELTISLPTNYTESEEVISALETARSNGWTLTIQTYTPEESTSTASTFGMQRIWVRKTQDENGSYVDANGNRFQVEWCVEIYSPENKSPEDLGYEQFRSVESAVQYWELTHYVDPTLEEQFNIINEEQ